jgi:hypothetical protein
MEMLPSVQGSSRILYFEFRGSEFIIICVYGKNFGKNPQKFKESSPHHTCYILNSKHA